MRGIKAMTPHWGVSFMEFRTTREEEALITRVIERLESLFGQQVTVNALQIRMDLAAIHSNGCPLDFERMLQADCREMLSDLAMMGTHLDRMTGEVHGYTPKFRR